MRICITLDDVIRAKTAQICKMYQKYIDPSINLDELDLSVNNLGEVLGFESDSEYKDFLYNTYSYEVFAEASTTEKMVDKTLNLWHMNLSNNDELDEPVEVMLANAFEFNNSIGYTYFFLSKIATRVREIYLPMDSSTIWDKCDVLVTATPNLISNKPDGKIVVKIEMPYNKDIESDYSYQKLSDFLNDNEIIEKLINKNV